MSIKKNIMSGTISNEYAALGVALLSMSQLVNKYHATARSNTTPVYGTGRHCVDEYVWSRL